MKRIEFKCSPGATVGAEMELQIVDRAGDLWALSPEILDRLGGEDERIKHELFCSMIEVNSGICDGVPALRQDLGASLARLRGACEALDARLVSAGTHPFADWRKRRLFPSDRYERLLDRNRWLMRRLMIFGLHIHLGMRDGDHAMRILNAWLNYVPHLLALSASSPFWHGRDTGLAACRPTLYEAIPTAGHPCVFRDWDGFCTFFGAASRAGAVDGIKDLWWDVRPQPGLGTIELRVCDAQPTLEQTVELVALAHAVTAWLDALDSSTCAPGPPPEWVRRDNKWRAARWGLGADFVVDEGGRSRPAREAIAELIAQALPFARRQGAGAELERLAARVHEPPSYERQRRWFAESRKLRTVTSRLAQEFATGQPLLHAAA